MSAMMQQVLDDVLRALLHKTQCSILSVLYSNIHQEMLDLPRKFVIEKTIDTHFPMLFSTYAATEGL